MTEVWESAFVSKAAKPKDILQARKFADKVTRTKRTAGVQVRGDRMQFTEHASRPGGKILNPMEEGRVTGSSVDGGGVGSAYAKTGGGFTTGAKRTALYGGGATTYGGLVALDQREKKAREASARRVKKGMTVEVSKSAFAIEKSDKSWKATKPNRSMKSQGQAFKNRNASRDVDDEFRSNSRTYLKGPHTTENLKTEAGYTAAGAGVGIAASAASRGRVGRGAGALYGGLLGNAVGDDKVDERAMGRARQTGIKRGRITTGNDSKNVTLFTGRRKNQSKSAWEGGKSAFGIEKAFNPAQALRGRQATKGSLKAISGMKVTKVPGTPPSSRINQARADSKGQAAWRKKSSPFS